MKFNFADGLTLLFIGLKLGNVIVWPWVWVLSPLWIGVIFSILEFYLKPPNKGE